MATQSKGWDIYVAEELSDLDLTSDYERDIEILIEDKDEEDKESQTFSNSYMILRRAYWQKHHNWEMVQEDKFMTTL